MAGHSKWANIKFRKAGQDAKRGKLFTKLIREITIAAKNGGLDPSSNPSLRQAIDKALAGNMTKDTIEKAIKRGAGTDDSQNLEEIRYEGYGSGGVAVIVDCLSDNKNRTVGEVRHAFTKHGGNLGTEGSVSYMFEKKGVVLLDKPEDAEKVEEQAIELGALDILTLDEGNIEVLVSVEDYDTMIASFKEQNIGIISNDIKLLAQNKADVADDKMEQVAKLVDALEDLDDVQNVYTNLD